VKGTHMVTIAADRPLFLIIIITVKVKGKNSIRVKNRGPVLLTGLSPKIIFTLLNV
jgi:hypothetical protein